MSLEEKVFRRTLEMNRIEISETELLIGNSFQLLPKRGIVLRRQGEVDVIYEKMAEFGKTLLIFNRAFSALQSSKFESSYFHEFVSFLDQTFIEVIASR